MRNKKWYVIGFQYGEPTACSSTDGRPELFDTEAEAEADIVDFLDSLKTANMDNDLEWRAVDSARYFERELANLCGL
jgi:hypothetical protein